MPKFQAARVEKTFVDDEGVTIHYYVWQSGAPKAVVQIVHGIGEYATRYEPLAQALVDGGLRGLRRSTTAGTARPASSSTAATSRSSGGRGRAASARRSAASGSCATSPHDDEPRRADRAARPQHGLAVRAADAQRARPTTTTPSILTGTAYRTLRHMNSGDLASGTACPAATGTSG